MHIVILDPIQVPHLEQITYVLKLNEKVSNSSEGVINYTSRQVPMSNPYKRESKSVIDPS